MKRRTLLLVYLGLVGARLGGATQWVEYRLAYHPALGSGVRFGPVVLYPPWPIVGWSMRLYDGILFVARGSPYGVAVFLRHGRSGVRTRVQPMKDQRLDHPFRVGESPSTVLFKPLEQRSVKAICSLDRLGLRSRFHAGFGLCHGKEVTTDPLVCKSSNEGMSRNRVIDV